LEEDSFVRILVIEDNDLVQKALVRRIHRVHPLATVDAVDGAPEAIKHLDTFAYDYIVCDFNLRAGTGGDVLAHVRAGFAFYIRNRRFILFSSDAEEVAKLGHDLVIDKAEPEALVAALRGGTRS
jgi:CheY-like chemotaxis protein